MSDDVTTASTGAREVADAVTAVPGVTGLYGGAFGEIATYLPGGRVSGVVVDDDSAHVHVVVDMDHDLRGVADRVRRRIEELTGLPVTVTVEDISVHTDRLGADPTAGSTTDD
ncbi:Asp23/Gls24 family envelope stress response protein [Gordonia hankookensis]|uniref:Asp23/Gls24 family envelope stress response protein n=1 Tax=Gordonia hankookensis TaxID=589403 RepID=A0ABR7W763_9ACTN|nr:Asp23/Gls24 family envelope stress response protein [Gordonia hankookensis]MBD1318435.1 Asp23/Gls24 family envelope stress response protein [Gordonia hankookensis]